MRGEPAVSGPSAAPLPVCEPARLPQREEGKRWLVERLWPLQAVGIIGGAAKSFKSWMALDLAVSVATGTPCLGSFAVQTRGRTLVYAAEDSLPDIRSRLEGLARRRGLSLQQLNMRIITVPQLLLDRQSDSDRLNATVAAHQPVLLILDPFVRLHSAVDENSAGEVAAVLGRLRTLQRTHGVSVVLVHHARKQAAGLRAGQALRGSTDFHAWTDVTIYMQRQGDRATLNVEHRSAAAVGPLRLSLSGSSAGNDLSLTLSSPAPTDGAKTDRDSIASRLLAAMQTAGEPLSQARLRQLITARHQRIAQALQMLQAQGRIHHTAAGWALSADAGG